MFQKIVRFSYWLIPIVFMGLCPIALQAQDTAAPEKKEQKAEKAEMKAAGHTKTVTGCVEKGDEPDEYMITGKDGKTWGVTSKTVKLDQHLGHTVTVTGSAHRESKAEAKAEKAEEKKEGKMEKASGRKEYGDIEATSVKMVSDTCTK